MNPRTGKMRGADGKESKAAFRREVYDAKYLRITWNKKEEERKTETVFDVSEGLLTALVGVDLVRDNTNKIAAFDMDYTLIKTNSEARLANGSLDWDILNQ